jgi:hypothetical protein
MTVTEPLRRIACGTRAGPDDGPLAGERNKRGNRRRGISRKRVRKRGFLNQCRDRGMTRLELRAPFRLQAMRGQRLSFGLQGDFEVRLGVEVYKSPHPDISCLDTHNCFSQVWLLVLGTYSAGDAPPLSTIFV